MCHVTSTSTLASALSEKKHHTKEHSRFLPSIVMLISMVCELLALFHIVKFVNVHAFAVHFMNSPLIPNFGT